MNLVTRLRSTGMRHFSSAGFLEKQRSKGRKLRQKLKAAPTVHYFHQADDPYSHLAVQKLDELKARYNLNFDCHLTAAADAAYQGSAAHFPHWARQDAASVAADFGVQFTPSIETPSAANLAGANQELAAHLTQEDFAQVATQVGAALWSGEAIPLQDSNNTADQAIASGNAKRQELGHYQGAMFFFEGEWFWGVDRLRSLEQRLAKEGYDQQSGPLCVPEPTPDTLGDKDASQILLEYFPSLRSPYTAIGHKRVLELIHSTGVQVQVRPVMPMLMRGIPAPRAKQRYIITDAGREGREFGNPLGRIVDPFGEPVKRAFALFPAADALGRGLDFVTAYLNASWFEGVDITKTQGLQTVAQQAGLDWDALQQGSTKHDWEAILDANLQELTASNLWGVPSFRVSGGISSNTRNDSYACWGQDRIWRVASEIARRA